jgi:hypothetical protein
MLQKNKRRTPKMTDEEKAKERFVEGAVTPYDNITAWVKTPDGQEWLKTEHGKEWLQTEEGQAYKNATGTDNIEEV